MDPGFQSVFVDPVDHSALEFEGTHVDGRWMDGWLRSEHGALWPVRAGIPDFVRRAIPGAIWKYGQIREMLDNGQFERNWSSREGLRNSPHVVAALRRAAAGSQPIIDVASGPGGGAMPTILQANPRACVMVTDAGTPVVHGWREHLGTEHPELNVSFAGFDLAHMPFRDDSVDVITSVGGFSNVHEQTAAWREAGRVLKPEGLIVAAEAFWDPDGLRRLAEARRRSDGSRSRGRSFTERLLRSRLGDARRAKSPGLIVTERSQAAGLTIVEEVVGEGRPVRANDNDWSRDAVRLGIEVWLRSQLYVLTKRGDRARTTSIARRPQASVTRTAP